MFEFHGWVVLRMTYKVDEEESLKDEAAMLVALRQVIASTAVANHFHFHDGFNGMLSLTVSGLRNHYQDEVTGVFEWLAQHAPGSYGLLYVLDHEGRSGEEYSDSFRVLKLVRGQLQELADPFLSPPVPVVEDACEL